MRSAVHFRWLIIFLLPVFGSLRSAPIAGNNIVGTTNYPNGGMRRVGALTLSSSLYISLYGGVIDPVTGYGYFSTAHASTINPGWVVKVDLNGPLPVEVGAVSCQTNEVNLNASVVDSAAGFGYFGTVASPGKVCKIALGAGAAPPTYVGTLTLNPGENNASGLVIDTSDPNPANHLIFVATGSNPAYVVKLGPGPDNGPPARLGAVQLNAAGGEVSMRRGVIDMSDPNPLNHGIYFATLGPTALVVKLTPGAGPNPVRVGATSPDATDHQIGSLVLDDSDPDPAQHYAAFGTYEVGNVTARVGKVALNGPGIAPVKLTSTPLNGGEIQLCTAVSDPASGYAFFSNDHHYPAEIYKIRFGAGPAPLFELPGKLTLCGGTVSPYPANGTNVINDPETLYGEVFMQSSVIDRGRGYAYFGADSNKGQVTKVAISQKGTLKAIRIVLPAAAAVGDINFYAHAAKGGVRLGIYDNNAPKNLLWQSAAVPAAAGWMTVPLSAGTPASLNLAAGTYWLAWESDSTGDVASYSPGAAGDGWYYERPFGSFPATVAAPVNPAPCPAPILAPTTSAESWSLYVNYCNPLTGPGNTLLAGKGGANVNLNWGAGAGAGSYNVRRCSGGAGCNPVTIASPASPNYADPVLASLTSYYYLSESANACATAP